MAREPTAASSQPKGCALTPAFAGVVEANLRSLVEIAERRRLETALQQSLDQTARHVVERTSELQDANTALRVRSKN